MIDIDRTSWTLGDLDLTRDGLGIVAASFDPGQSGGNGRTIALTVLIARPDLGAMADAQADLDIECAKPLNVLRYLPRGLGAATRYIVGEPTVTTVPDESAERTGFRKVEISWPTDYFPTADEPSTLTYSGGATAITVGGSRPAALSLAVTGSTLGTVLACAQPDFGVPWNPSLRQWTASPNSGSSITAPSTFHPSQAWRASLAPTIPAASIQDGPHSLVGRFYRASAGMETISWTGPGGQAYSTSVAWTAAGALIVPLGVLVLDRADGDAVLSFSFSASVYVDDVFATYAGDKSGLVIVDCGSATAMQVDAPAVDNRLLGRITVASRAPGVGLIAASDLPLSPSTARLYVATTGTPSPTVAASWLPAVQAHAVAAS